MNLQYALTRNWVIAMVLGWILLAYGYVHDNKWSVGLALLIFIVFLIERLYNMRHDRDRT